MGRTLTLLQTHTHPPFCSRLAAGRRRRLWDQACLRGNKPAAPPSTLFWGARERERERERERPLHMQTWNIMFAGCLSCCLGGEAAQMDGRRQLRPQHWNVHLRRLRCRLVGNMYSKYLNTQCDSRYVHFMASPPDEKDTTGTVTLKWLKNKTDWKSIENLLQSHNMQPKSNNMTLLIRCIEGSEQVLLPHCRSQKWTLLLVTKLL